MASIQKRARGWFAQVRRAGVSKSASFSTKAEAVAWATAVEAEILAGARGVVPNKSFGDLLERYRDEVSCTKRGERWERMRIGLMLRDPIAAVKLADMSAADFAAWRDRRLRQVSAASVLRERNLLSHAVNTAVRDWGWLKSNVLKDVRMPADAPPRDRTLTEDEIERLLFALGYDRDEAPVTISARVGAAMLFAIETGMRAGEIAGLSWADINLEKRTARVRGGKTASAKRAVPLSAEALRLLRQIPRDTGSVFGLASGQIDALFRKAKARAMIPDLHFHDTRHTAITRLARKLDVLDLARMIGHRDLRMLMVYYNAKAEDIAGRLD
jgi:integrase